MTFRTTYRDPDCEKCNYDTHVCPGCGIYVRHGETVCVICTREKADERRCLGCDEPWQVPGTTVCQTCIVAAQDAALARQDADRG